ncbi:ATP-binding protein, partial [Streptomyces sp. NPDC059766]
MRVLLVGAGGVGTAITRIAARRSFFEAMVVADHDPARSEAGGGGGRGGGGGGCWLGGGAAER